MSESQAAASLSSGEFSFISDPSRVGAEAEAPEAQQAARFDSRNGKERTPTP